MPLQCYANAIYLKDKAYIDFEALFRINSAGAFFVTRTKSTLRYSIVEQSFDIDQTTGLKPDKTIELTVPESKRLYPEKLRPVEFYDGENNELLLFLTNNFDVSALKVAYLYKTVSKSSFFQMDRTKSDSQKNFGDIPQMPSKYLWTAICSYRIVAYTKHLIKSPLSIYEIMQILRIPAFDKTPIRQLLTEHTPNRVDQNIKVQLSLFC